MADYILGLTGEKIEEALEKGLYAVTTTSQALTEAEQEVVRNNVAAASNQAIKNITRSNTTFTATREDGTTFTFDQQDTNTWDQNTKTSNGYVTAPGSSNNNKVWKTNDEGVPGWRNEQPVEHYDIVTTSAAGLAPALPASEELRNKQFLKGTGVWADIPEYKKVSKTANGLCPILPNEDAYSKYLRQDGNWAEPSNTTYTFATGSANGTISVTPLGGIATDIVVKGLKSAAYTESTAYATAAHTHATSITSSSAANQITLAANTKYAINAGGTSYVFTTPTDTNTWRPLGTGSDQAAAGNHTHTLSISQTGTSSINLAANTVYTITAGGNTYAFKTPADTNTTYSSKAAASGGTDVSLVTTGEKYVWNNKSTLTLGTTSSTAAAGNHTHTISLSAGGTSTVTLAANTAYTLTAGGKSVIFKTPPDTNTTYSAGSGISISSTTISNSGVRAISSGNSNGTISVNTSGTSADVTVKGFSSGVLTTASGGTGVSVTSWANWENTSYTSFMLRPIAFATSVPSAANVKNGAIVLIYS